MKLHFSELFELNNGLIEPKKPVKLGGVQLKKGKKYGDGASSTGIDLVKHRHSSFDVVKEKDVYVVKTIYD